MQHSEIIDKTLAGFEKYDEYELLKSISDGDEEAFTLFFRQHYPRLKAGISRFFKDPALIEDALQEVFIRVWLNRDQLSQIENITAWTNTIASRICINQIEKDLIRQKHLSALHQQGIEAPVVPIERVAVREINRLVTEAVHLMPASRKQIYLMSRSEGLKPAQIAESLNLSVNTVRNMLVTALKDIRHYLRSHGHTLSLTLLPALFSIFFHSE
ncbi:MAG: sigma-70 family RNA polymerase sigma factor [Chitinophagaceae bacterium]|nr:sigma-70 family RNA polymerase sigma factor [Chitinophagaceae bacterium]